MSKEGRIAFLFHVFLHLKLLIVLECLANLDVALFDKVYGVGEVKTIEEFKSKVKDDLNKMFVSDIDRLLKGEISKTLIKKLKLKLPDQFLKKWILSSNKEAKQEDIDKEYESYSDGLKWQLIENFIIRDQNIKVSGEELLKFTMDLMGNQYIQYGMMIPEEEELKKTAEKVLSNKEEGRKINDMIYDKKVMEYLKDTLRINDKFVNHEDFTKKVAELTQ